jgi:hypothetical protein
MTTTDPAAIPREDYIRTTLSDLTLGEVEHIEDITGMVIGQLFPDGQLPTAKGMLALVYVVRRRTRPEYTLDDARGESVRVVIQDPPDDDDQGAGGGDDADDPTEQPSGHSERSSPDSDSIAPI